MENADVMIVDCGEVAGTVPLEVEDGIDDCTVAPEGTWSLTKV